MSKDQEQPQGSKSPLTDGGSQSSQNSEVYLCPEIHSFCLQRFNHIYNGVANYDSLPYNTFLSLPSCHNIVFLPT